MDKINEKVTHLTTNLFTNKHTNCLSFPDVKNALPVIHNDFVVVSKEKATGNKALVCKTFYAFAIAKDFGLNNKYSTATFLHVIILIKL